MNEFQPPYLPAVSQCNAVMLYSIFAHHVVLMYLWMCESDCVQYTSQKPCKPYPLCSPCSRQAWSSTLLGSNSCQGLSGPRRIQHCCWCMFLGIGGIPKSLLTGHLNFLMQHTWNTTIQYFHVHCYTVTHIDIPTSNKICSCLPWQLLDILKFATDIHWFTKPTSLNEEVVKLWPLTWRKVWRMFQFGNTQNSIFQLLIQRTFDRELPFTSVDESSKSNDLG